MASAFRPTRSTRSFRAAAEALKRAQPALYKEVGKAMRAAGELVAKDARSIVSDYSTSIPPTIKVSVRRATRVAVQAGGVKQGAKAIQASGYGGTAGVGGTSRKIKELEKQCEFIVIAGLFELGNKGGSKSAGSTSEGMFRHPVFGKDAWVEQPMHPYLLPAGEKNKAAIDAIVYEALSKVTDVIVLEN
jgi:hypothetical protein